MKNPMVWMVFAIVFLFVLAGCTQQPTPAPTPAPTPVPVPASATGTSGEIGEGDQAVNENEIPPYDASADQELENLVNQIEG
jgi:hypothetical protein